MTMTNNYTLIYDQMCQAMDAAITWAAMAGFAGVLAYTVLHDASSPFLKRMGNWLVIVSVIAYISLGIVLL